ncbi:hypothetical protein [Ramlibacter sp. WS9]|uniref:hypothetical protein n=1 Tax=Ramlibacter sp. WS9 TaxID=1882741 RepID=UPI001141130C|nr:hypothetical protein [Ramlibacter sp. WS9]ROZ79470.1 hypothetical protein EEB15_00715 [Ramlibacter sp. WS9]
MNIRVLLLATLCGFLGACATIPDNTKQVEFEGRSLKEETVELSPGKYKVTLAGFQQTKAQVERAYASRAAQMCDGRGVAGEPEYVGPLVHRSPAFGPSVPGAYTLAGIVTCPDAVAAPTAAVAVLRDSIKIASTRKAQFFVVSKIGDARIEDSYLRTAVRNQGRGLQMTPTLVERNVPARMATFTIEGRTRYAAPIIELTSGERLLDVVGTVTFAPENHRTYVVKGELGERYSAVWIEEELDGGGSRMIGKKIETGSP